MRRKSGKLAGCVGSMPTYSSMWKTLTAFQSMPGSVRSAVRKVSCELPVARMTLARPFALIAAAMMSRASSAAASPIAALVA